MCLEIEKGARTVEIFQGRRGPRKWQTEPIRFMNGKEIELRLTSIINRSLHTLYYYEHGDTRTRYFTVILRVKAMILFLHFWSENTRDL